MSHHAKLLSAMIALAHETDLDSQPSGVVQIVGGLLACLRGSEALEGLQIAPLHSNIAWREFGLIREIIGAVESEKDVEALCSVIAEPEDTLARWTQQS